MKVFIKKLSYFFIILATSTMITCGGDGSAGDSPGVIDVSGIYNVTFTENGVPSEIGVWILKQTGYDVAVLWGEAGPMTVSGSNLIIDWKGDGLTVNGILAISGETIYGPVTWDEGGEITNFNLEMTRTSTSATVPLFYIPEASITVDGIYTDWDSVATYVTDAPNDATGGTGTDIQSVKIARGGSNVYLLIKTDEPLSTDYKYELAIHDTSYQDFGSIGFEYRSDLSSWQVYGAASGYISVSSESGDIELSFPYSVFNPGQKYIVEQRFYRNGGVDPVDEADFIGYTILPSL